MIHGKQDAFQNLFPCVVIILFYSVPQTVYVLTSCMCMYCFKKVIIIENVLSEESAQTKLHWSRERLKVSKLGDGGECWSPLNSVPWRKKTKNKNVFWEWENSHTLLMHSCTETWGWCNRTVPVGHLQWLENFCWSFVDIVTINWQSSKYVVQQCK
jgi:hypothetical protein